MSGTEVEGIDWVGAPRDPENLSRFVVGKVLTKEKHPNADKLNLCTVEVGEANGGVRQIVCGAHNFEAGDTVPVSLSGAMLENGLKLKKANLRGIESDGMIMSRAGARLRGEEPGHSGSTGRLDRRRAAAEVPAGERSGPRARADVEPAGLLQHLRHRPRGRDGGAAGTGAAAHRRPGGDGGAPAADGIQVEIADPDLCPRYGATVIRGVKTAESPAWLKARLTHAGMRPISNVVDVTNYVMLAYGQPLHAFDAGKIRGGKLIARRAAAGEKIVTLDGVERALDDQMLVIADVERALVIAGVFGSQDAEIDEHTTDIVLEAANFAGPSILRTELHTGIRSEASNRFEKGIDANLVPGALDFADRLFSELCGGTVAPGMVDAGGVPPAPAPLRFRPGKADGLLGYEIPATEQAGILRRLDCTVDETGAEWAVTPPTFRPDLIREVDLIEEVGRIAGYGMAPETLPRHTTAGGLTKVQKVRRSIRAALAGCGLDEVITYSFIRPDALAPLGLPEGDIRLDPVRLSNPMSVDQSVMRTMLLPGLLKTVRDNLDRLNDPPNLFEIGKVYLWDRARAGAGARGRARRDAASRAGGGRRRPLRSAGDRELDRCRPPDGLLHAQGCVGAVLAVGGAAAVSTGRWATRPSTSRSCTRQRRRWSVSPAPAAGGARPAATRRRRGVRHRRRRRRTSPPQRAAASRRRTGPCRLPRIAAATRRLLARTWPSWSPGLLGGGRRAQAAAPAASSSAACASSTCMRATRWRRTSARWRCASSCARPSARWARRTSPACAPRSSRRWRGSCQATLR